MRRVIAPAGYPLCRHCGQAFSIPASHKARKPVYCSDYCRRRARNRQIAEHRQFLTDHGLCPRCKSPIPHKGT